MTFQRGNICAVATAVAIVAGILITPMAGASQSSTSTPSNTDPALNWVEAPFTPPQSVSGNGPLANVVSDCEVRVDWPHISTTVSPRSVKVNGTASCTVSTFNVVHV
jgi:hypothetical protein